MACPALPISPMTDEMLMIRPARCLTIRRPTGLVRLKRALEIGVDHRVPVFALHAHEQAVARDAGIVDQNIDMLESRRDFFHRGICGSGIGDIQRERLGHSAGGANRLQRFLERLFAPRHRGNCRAFRRQRQRNRLAQATARAGDQGDFISKKFHI